MMREDCHVLYSFPLFTNSFEGFSSFWCINLFYSIKFIRIDSDRISSVTELIILSLHTSLQEDAKGAQERQPASKVLQLKAFLNSMNRGISTYGRAFSNRFAQLGVSVDMIYKRLSLENYNLYHLPTKPLTFPANSLIQHCIVLSVCLHMYINFLFVSILSNH